MALSSKGGVGHFAPIRIKQSKLQEPANAIAILARQSAINGALMSQGGYKTFISGEKSRPTSRRGQQK